MRTIADFSIMYPKIYALYPQAVSMIQLMRFGPNSFSFHWKYPIDKIFYTQFWSEDNISKIDFMRVNKVNTYLIWIFWRFLYLEVFIFPSYIGQDLVRCHTVRFDNYSFVRCRFTSQAKRTIQKSICQSLPPARSKVMIYLWNNLVFNLT